MTRATFSAFLVEDEPLCRADFRQALRAFPEIDLVGEAPSLRLAREFLQNRSVDLLFLDLSLGRENGLDLVENLASPPMVIALTAHPHHAARGFELNWVDYVLKPVEEDRLRQAIEKARHRRLAASLQPDRITFIAEIERKKTVLQLSEITGAESMGNYVLLRTTRGNAIKRATFKHVKNKLPASLYLQISRGRILARHQIKEWKRDPGGRLVLGLASGENFHVSRSQTAQVLQQLQDRFGS